tara:strand:- start:6276 stop:6689 length:414 start_codon:yes stop_codon:yes gene_type:complete
MMAKVEWRLAHELLVGKESASLDCCTDEAVSEADLREIQPVTLLDDGMEWVADLYFSHDHQIGSYARVELGWADAQSSLFDCLAIRCPVVFYRHHLSDRPFAVYSPRANDYRHSFQGKHLPLSPPLSETESHVHAQP